MALTSFMLAGGVCDLVVVPGVAGCRGWAGGLG